MRRRLLLAAGGVAVAAAGVCYLLLHRSHEAMLLTSALRVAETVSAQVSADRAEYASNVVDKLVQDGTGASRDSETARGFVELPAQFVHNVSRRVRDQAGDLYSYSLISRWNLNPSKGLDEEFDRWAWARLAEQNESFMASGEAPAAGYRWRPAYRVELIFGEPTLRYMRADAAAARACVDCHERYEQMESVRAIRLEAEVEQGKTWEAHELMGGLRVDVSLSEVAALAAEEDGRLLVWLGVTLAGGLAIVFALIDRGLITPIERLLEAPDAELAPRLREILGDGAGNQSTRSNSR